MQGSGDDDFVVFFHFVADINLNFAVFTRNFRDVDVEASGVLQFLVDRFVNALRAVFPRPQILVYEVHCGCKVKVFHDVCRGDFVKEAVSERGVRPDPDFLRKFNLVEFAEILEVHAQIFEVGVFADNVFAGDRIVPVVFTLGNSLVTGVLISLVLGRKKRAEFLTCDFIFKRCGISRGFSSD